MTVRKTLTKDLEKSEQSSSSRAWGDPREQEMPPRQLERATNEESKFKSLVERLVSHQRIRGATENMVVETENMDTFTKTRHFECGRTNYTGLGRIS